MLGIALLDKPEGVSSFRALSDLKRACKTKKVGHTGTLDPFATGLMVALVGQATRLARFFSGLDKSYHAVFSFGSETDTSDSTGTVTRTAVAPAVDDVMEALSGFRGPIEQIPPAFSAVHVNGKRAYELARSGEQVEVPSRIVSIKHFSLEQIDKDSYAAEITCSSGTYIRSLARDLGRAVGSAAHVSVLRRTTVGPFEVDDSVPPCEFAPEKHLRSIAPSLELLPGIVRVEVPPELVRPICHGRKLSVGDVFTEAPSIAGEVLLTREGEPLALVTIASSGNLDYSIVFSGGSL
ncbi:MAG: tRNA pseudouridine(55) synthase TruB [Spirochaetota bacterium]